MDEIEKLEIKYLSFNEMKERKLELDGDIYEENGIPIIGIWEGYNRNKTHEKEN